MAQPFSTQPLQALWAIDDWCHRHLFAGIWNREWMVTSWLCDFLDRRLWRDSGMPLP
jgi:hypothetical protein